MDEVAFQEEVVAVLKKSLEGADVSIRALKSHMQRTELCVSFLYMNFEVITVLDVTSVTWYLVVACVLTQGCKLTIITVLNTRFETLTADCE